MSRWMVALAAALCACELLAWWWAVQLDANHSLLLPWLLGAAAAVVTLLCTAWLWSSAQAGLRELRDSNEVLTSSLNALDVGLEVWDAQDRLLLFNKKINHMRIDFRTPKDLGKTFEELLLERLQRGEILAAVGQEDQWLVQRLEARGHETSPQLKEYVGDHWFMAYETRLPTGFLINSWVDVSELVQKTRVLEEMNSRLMLQTNLDPLTGLANRRSFDDMLAAECQRASRADGFLSLLMVDVDHFKLFNDHYGHLAGDECLRRVASVLHRCIRRAGELVARYGGEEFVVLLPGSDVERACGAAQLCLDKMLAEGIAHRASPTGPQVTISIGVACARGRDLVAGRIINAADTAMYRAKMGGRARFELAEQHDWDIDKDTPRTGPGTLQ